MCTNVRRLFLPITAIRLRLTTALARRGVIYLFRSHKDICAVFIECTHKSNQIQKMKLSWSTEFKIAMNTAISGSLSIFVRKLNS